MRDAYMGPSEEMANAAWNLIEFDIVRVDKFEKKSRILTAAGRWTFWV